MRDLPMPGSGQQHDLAFAFSGKPPALEQQRDFLFTSDQRAEPAAGRSLEAVCGGAESDHLPDMHWRANTLQRLFTEIRVIERSACELPSPLADDDATRLGDRLQPRRQVDGLAHRAFVLCTGM